MTGIRRVAIGGLRTRAPFSTLFAIDPATRQAVVADMRTRGFDESKPIDVWDDGAGLVVIDGHTRLEATKVLAMDDVPVYPHIFDDELSALDYAIHNQRDRRNLEGAALVNAIRIRDEFVRQSHGGNRNPYGSSGKPNGIKLSVDNLIPRKSGAEVAARIGVSESTVNRARAIYDDPIAVNEVEQGVSIAVAAERARARKRGTNGHADDPLPGARTYWSDLARNGRQDDEPWFEAMDHGSICRSIAGRAVSDIQKRLAMASEQGLDIPALMREYSKVATEWNLALKEARAVTRLIRLTIQGVNGDGDE